MDEKIKEIKENLREIIDVLQEVENSHDSLFIYEEIDELEHIYELIENLEELSKESNNQITIK
jgi:predicted RNA-binding protein with EMAP domain